MSYARFVGPESQKRMKELMDWDVQLSDVYVYHAQSSRDPNLSTLVCCGCILDHEQSGQWDYDSTEDMIAHLKQHRDAGHAVPDGIEDALTEDDADNFPKETP